jgi:hypothetical protein
MDRVYVDCREHPSDTPCSVTIAGTKEEVEDLATLHAVRAHGETDTPELRQQINRMMKPVEEYEKARHPAPA